MPHHTSNMHSKTLTHCMSTEPAVESRRRPLRVAGTERLERLHGHLMVGHLNQQHNSNNSWLGCGHGCGRLQPDLVRTCAAGVGPSDQLDRAIAELLPLPLLENGRLDQPSARVLPF